MKFRLNAFGRLRKGRVLKKSVKLDSGEKKYKMREIIIIKKFLHSIASYVLFCFT